MQAAARVAISMVRDAEDAVEEARQIRKGLDWQVEMLTRPDGRRVVPAAAAGAWHCNEETRAQLTEVLARAVSITRADMGNIQVFDPRLRALRIEAQLGFEGRFLDFFNRVHSGEYACGTALQTGKRVIIEDVTDSPVFRADSLEVMLDARARAVQSTPISGSSGHLLGVLSTHYHRCRRPSERDERFLDLLARRAARFIEKREVS